MHLSACLKRDAKVLLYFLPSKFIGNFFEIHSVFSLIYYIPPQKRNKFLQERRTTCSEEELDFPSKAKLISSRKENLYSKEDVQKKNWRGEMTPIKDLALESHQLKAGDIEQTDVATIHRNESLFRQLRQCADGVGSIHITQRS